MKDKTLPRNWRNNNPLNIRKTKDNWKGLATTQNDKSFFIFKSMKWGWRAAFVLLFKYYKKYGLVTIRQIITRWAPPEENNTLNYVEWVAAATDMPPTEMLPPPNDENKSLWLRMALAMAWYEGRIQPADMVRAGIDEEQDGWNMALCAE